MHTGRQVITHPNPHTAVSFLLRVIIQAAIFDIGNKQIEFSGAKSENYRNSLAVMHPDINVRLHIGGMINQVFKNLG
jgi:hypothetical protein